MRINTKMTQRLCAALVIAGLCAFGGQFADKAIAQTAGEFSKKELDETVSALKKKLHETFVKAEAANPDALVNRIAKMGDGHVVTAGGLAGLVCGRKDSAYSFMKHQKSGAGAAACADFNACAAEGHRWAQTVGPEHKTVAQSHEEADHMTTAIEAVRAGNMIYAASCGRIEGDADRRTCLKDDIEHGPLARHLVPSAMEAKFSEALAGIVELYDRYFHTPHGPAC